MCVRASMAASRFVYSYPPPPPVALHIHIIHILRYPRSGAGELFVKVTLFVQSDFVTRSLSACRSRPNSRIPAERIKQAQCPQLWRPS